MAKNGRKILVFVLAGSSLLCGVSAFAVDETRLLERFSLIGVIAQDSASSRSGVAVLKDRDTKRSLLMRTGDKLPQAEEWFVKQISRHNIILSGPGKDIQLAVGSAEEEKPVALEKEDGEKKPMNFDYRSVLIEDDSESFADDEDDEDENEIGLDEEQAELEKLESTPIIYNVKELMPKKSREDRLLERQALEEEPTNLE